MEWIERLPEERGDFVVPSRVSMRWLEFSTSGSAQFQDGEYLQLWVMTRGEDEGPRRICELVITREELKGVLDLIERPSQPDRPPESCHGDLLRNYRSR
jgi:hypothetical protein